MRKNNIQKRYVDQAIKFLEEGKGTLRQFSNKKHISYGHLRDKIIIQQGVGILEIKPKSDINFSISQSNTFVQIIKDNYKDYLNKRLSQRKIGKLHGKSGEYVRQAFSILGVQYCSLLKELKKEDKSTHKKDALVNKVAEEIESVKEYIDIDHIKRSCFRSKRVDLVINGKSWSVYKDLIKRNGTYINLHLPSTNVSGVIISLDKNIYIIPMKDIELHRNRKANTVYVRYAQYRRKRSLKHQSLDLFDYKERYDLLT